MSAKTCSSCGAVKPLDEFHKDRNRPDGRRSACKACRSQKNSKPERTALPPVEPPPEDDDELMRLARQRAIKETVENNWPEFTRRYARHADRLKLSQRWHKPPG